MISLGINCYYCAEENEESNITEKTKFIRSMQKLKREHQMIKSTTIKKALKAFQDNRFGLFIHLGPLSSGGKKTRT